MDPTTNDELLCSEYEEFRHQVNQSNVPNHLLRVYGDKPFNNRQNVNIKETSKTYNNKFSPNPTV